MYHGFTPTGGVYTTLTSMAMLSLLIPAALVAAVIVFYQGGEYKYPLDGTRS